MFKTLLLAFLLFLVIDSAAQQDTILFMNGQIQPCKILSSDGTDVTFEFKKRKKLKVKNVHKSELFGIVEKGERSIYYTMNAIVGDDLSVQEVEIFMAGQRDAKDNFNVVPVWLGGLSFGVLSGILGKSNLPAA